MPSLSIRPPFAVRALMISLVLGGLAGCASLPSSGPDVNGIVKAGQGSDAAFRILDLTTFRAPDSTPSPPSDVGRLQALAGTPQAAPPDLIDVGDIVQVTIFEVGPALFSGSSATPAPLGAPPAANAEVLPLSPVAPDGTITVPYVGRVEAAGHPPGDVAAAIEGALRGKSQSPQVLVTVHADEGNTVVLMGDVKTPGRKPLSYRREHLLDMIAIAGGPTNAKSETLVRITRGGISAEERLADVESASVDDVMLQPQDRVELIFRPRTFTAFGATGKVSEIPFQAPRVTLAEALARMGGPLDQQADPTGIFIFRSSQEKAGLPTLYRLNLDDPRGYLAAQSFEVQDKDLIYIANAQANSWSKLLGIINTIVSPVVTAKYLSH